MQFPLRHEDLDATLNDIGTKIVQAVGDVRRELGVGLVESVYMECLAEELREAGLLVDTEVQVPVIYKGRTLEKTFRMDMVVGGRVVVEGKATEVLHPSHYAKTLTYLRLSGKDLGYLVNFHAVPLRDGIQRLVPAGLPVI